MRLIDADALIKRIMAAGWKPTPAAEISKSICLGFAEDAPTIDAVPVDKIFFADLYLANGEAIATFKFGNQGITLRTEREDVVQVVRCKDCDCWCEEMKVGHADLGNESAPCSEWSDRENGHIRYTKATDFCSYGERSDK